MKDITKIRDLRFGKLSRNVGSVSSEGKKISTSKQDKLQNLGENGMVFMMNNYSQKKRKLVSK